MNKQSFDLFGGRYTVEVGKLGGITIISNIAHSKVLKVYGKKKDNLRFVNLTRIKGGPAESYRLSDIVDHVLDSKELLPITEEDINKILCDTLPPDKLNDPLIIEALEVELDHYGNKTYKEELEDYTRYYSKVSFTKTSNGFLRFNYKVSTYCIETKVTTNSTTEVFTDKNVIHITDRDVVDKEALKEIVALLITPSV